MKTTSDTAKSQLLKKLMNQTAPKQSGEPVAKQATGVNRGDYEIARIADRPYYPASFAQKRMFLLHQMDSQSVAYNLPLAMYIEGEVDTQRFQTAVNQLVERHECLRTGVRMVDQEIVQFTDLDVSIPIQYVEVEEKEIQELMKRFSRPFDLAKPSLARIALAEVGTDRHLLLLDVHHIIADGTSLQVILRDLMAFYNEVVLPPLQLRYRDYAVWQEQWFASEAVKKQEKFWLNMFASDVPILDLPTDFPRPDILAPVGAHHEFAFSRQDTESLKRLAKQCSVTDYTLFLGVLSILLAKYSGQNDIVVGSPIAGRRHPKLQELVGLFVNTIALRSQPEASKKFVTYIKELRETVHSAIDSQDYPFETLVEKTGVTRNINRNPLFDVMFSMINMKKTASQFQDLKISAYSFEREVANFDLELYMTEENNEMQFRLEYNSSLFKAETIQQMVQHFQFITRQLIEDPDREIAAIQLLDETERAKALAKHHGPVVAEEDLIFTKVFEEQVRQTPHAMAAICEDRTLTYSELNAWANRVANGLLEQGLPEEALVTLWLDRELEFLASMIGVFKSALAYVPVDPALPDERIRTILEESKSRLIVTEAQYVEVARAIAGENVQIVLIEDLLESGHSAENPGISVVPANLAYVIFTSGSTGKPKGAMVEHQGMLNHLRAKVTDLNLTSFDRVAETATQSFDVSVWQFLTALVAGGTTIIFKGVTAWQPKPLLEEIRAHDVTVFETVPSHLIVLLDEIEESRGATGTLPLRWMMLNGEQLLSELCRRWFRFYPDIPIINAYGPTECSDDVTHHFVPNVASLKRSAIPISGTIRGMRLYVLNEQLNQVPRGVVGELYVGGIGVGRGYLGDPVKTAAAFLPDMFAEEPGKRMYKTGDLVRELADGTLEFLGRRDHQVKINGMRIELSEIEHALLTTEMVRETVVVAGQWGRSQGKQLCAYVVLKPGIELAELQLAIQSVLPGHMVPAYWMNLDVLPLLLNGKVNRKALPVPERNTSNQIEFVAPQTDDQRLLAKLWADVLDLEESSIGLQHEFFKLGGTSLKAMRLVSKIKTETDVELPFTAIFAGSVLEEFTKLYQQARESSVWRIESVAAEIGMHVPALSEHQRIYRQNSQMPLSVVFNMPYRSVVEGELDTERAEAAFQAVCDRHWIMKANVILDESEGLIFMSNPSAAIEFHSGYTNDEEVAENWRQFVRPFALDQEPMFRMQVLTVNPRRHYIFFDNHTISADFTSKELILREFVSLYLGQPLEPVGMHYPEYIRHRLARAESAAALAQKTEWESEFAQGAKRLRSPEASCLAEVRPETGKRLTLHLEESLLSKIVALSKTYGVSEYNICQAAFTLALSKQFGQDEFFLLSLVTDRDKPGFDQIVGLLFDTIPIPQQVAAECTVAELLAQTQQNSRQAYTKRDYPAIQMYEEQAEQDGGWSDGYFDTTMVWVENNSFDFNKVGFSVREIRDDDDIMMRFDLRLEAYRGESSLMLVLEYRRRLFFAATADRILEQILSGLEFIANHPSEKLSIWRRPHA
ncbi:amino acid adenylation domain-containing protein [Paenibacillus sophorae]|uniref:Amino acid adenylation domain-containing protein n=1 Tax=Paenibacillus sophorae TaxID=1333845 RepID=A0A1H8SY68_9BACL|nr:non-ribosomal peptide synthetase [Paenibacillus sophorae]QWU15606.1 non-ribosomal peptide synthetase [Paenibacillus sophorae]SEO83622.1 amino acid adenylation domain-containing protein [Paenibacillus sophorae]